MAACVRHVRASGPLLAQVASYLPVTSHVNSTPWRRFLFSHEILGVDSYKRQRISVADRLSDAKDSFVARMSESLNTEKYVFTEDLKTFLHIAETDRDIDVAAAMIKRYHQQVTSGSLAMSTFRFGPLVMRLLYIHDKPDLALSLATDAELKGFFEEMTCTLVLMNLLYNSGRYDDALDQYRRMQEKQSSTNRFPSDCTTLAIACLYHKNTPEACDEMMEILKSISENRGTVSTRTMVLASLFALKQGRTNQALEILSLRGEAQNNSILNLKIVCYCHLDRVEDVLPILRRAMKVDSPSTVPRMRFFLDTLSAVSDAVAARKSPELSREFSSLKQALGDGGHISNQMLEEFALQPILKRLGSSDSFKTRNKSAIGGMRSRGPREFQRQLHWYRRLPEL